MKIIALEAEENSYLPLSDVAWCISSVISSRSEDWQKGEK
jgi:hypothetical protein